MEKIIAKDSDGERNRCKKSLVKNLFVICWFQIWLFKIKRQGGEEGLRTCFFEKSTEISSLVCYFTFDLEIMDKTKRRPADSPKSCCTPYKLHFQKRRFHMMFSSLSLKIWLIFLINPWKFRMLFLQYYSKFHDLE